MERNTLTVTQLNHYLKGLLEADPLLEGLYVRGELSNYKMYPSGHHYFTLKDAESSLKCVMFRSNAQRLRFRPENGMAVTAMGRVAVYPRDGVYQLYCSALLPDGTGDLQVAFQQLKAKLDAEGLFDAAHKKPLPRYPGRIALITSAAGAAVHDMIRVLGKRWPLAEVLLLPVRVQGAEAPGEIAAAIRYANQRKIADLIITGRGGGSMEDLWAFNDERVARAIYASDLPVISAVGHEPDVTIADFVADVRAATPSNAAELAVPDRAELRETLALRGRALERAMSKKLRELSAHLTDLGARRVLRSPGNYVEQKRMELDFLINRLLHSGEKQLEAKRHACGAMAAKLDALSPLKVLGRGYAIAETAAGETLRSSAQAAPGEEIRVRLEKGALRCSVLEAEPAEAIAPRRRKKAEGAKNGDEKEKL